MITDSTLRAFSKTCRDLQVLCVPGCTHLSDQGLKAVGHLKKLHVLNIADCTRSGKLYMYILCNFIHKPHPLIVRVSDAGIRYVVEGSSGSHIRELNLTNCAKLSDVSPLRISQQ